MVDVKIVYLHENEEIVYKANTVIIDKDNYCVILKGNHGIVINVPNLPLIKEVIVIQAKNIKYTSNEDENIFANNALFCFDNFDDQLYITDEWHAKVYAVHGRVELELK